jgi:hypothetical protein
MIAPVRCSACHNDISVPPGGYRLTVVAKSMEDCEHCHQTLPRKDVSWYFCSVKCFGRLQQCKTCDGKGYNVVCDNEYNTNNPIKCEACKGVGLSIAL